jgi:hypothetical protein
MESDPQFNRTVQFIAYSIISLLAILFTLILVPSSNTYYHRFIGKMNPIVLIVFLSIVGAAALWFLQARYGFVLFKGRGTIPGVKLSAVLATVLGIAIIIADFFIRYPADTNVPVPQALLFYPSIGFGAEIIFHVLPLVLLLSLLDPLGGWIGREKVIWAAIILVAVLEPIFQVAFEGKPFTWGAAYTLIHVFVIAFMQLYVFRRYDFISMYLFRIFYYMYWHILWGVIRLEILFK